MSGAPFITNGYWYLASPYSKYPDGPEAAYEVAAQASALLLANGIPHYAPIVYSHPLARYVPLDPRNFRHWEVQNHAMMARAHGIIILKAKSWETSDGVADESALFTELNRPKVYMIPGLIPGELLAPIGEFKITATP